MLKRVFTLFLLISTISNVQAQKNKNEAAAQSFTYEHFIVNDTLYKYQLGINTRFALEGLFNDSIRTPVELLIRKQVSPYGAIRLRLMGMTQNYKKDVPLAPRLKETHITSIGLALGYEWQNLIARRWKWYYGAEVQGKLRWDNALEESEYYNANVDEVYDHRRVYKKRTNQVALLPFAGIRFHITPYLFVSTEMKIEAFFEQYKSRTDDSFTRKDGTQPNFGGGFSEFVIENNDISFRPYTGIFLNYIL